MPVVAPTAMATSRSRLLPVPGVWAKVRLVVLALLLDVVASCVTVSAPPLISVAVGLERVAKPVAPCCRVAVMAGLAGKEPLGTLT